MSEKKASKNEIKNCPDCGFSGLTWFEGEALCGSDRCSWDSFKQSVDSGEMDEFFKQDLDALITAQEAEFTEADCNSAASNEIGAA